jgi:hypothetical protein
MKIITINKLQNLINKGWEYNNKKFILLNNEYYAETLSLVDLKCKFPNGDVEDKHLGAISLKNLSELEFYGLKVVLNKKPKLFVSDKKLLGEDLYVARDKCGTLYFYFGHPKRNELDNEWCQTGALLRIADGRFPFITWESGKAWSRSELMGLEVEE